MSKDFNEMLEGLKKNYLEQLPQRILALQAEYDKSNLEALRESFHKLKGTGKTYGIPEISEVCEIGERITTNEVHLPQVKIIINLLSKIHSFRQEHSDEFPLHNNSDFSKLNKL